MAGPADGLRKQGAVVCALLLASVPILLPVPALAFAPAATGQMPVLAGGAPALRHETLDELRTDFRRETDPVKRAKLFPKLGNALLDEMKKQGDADKFEQSLALLKEYRDSADAALSGLEAMHRDAEKHSAGYRELEVHLRQSLHRVDDIVRSFPLDERDPFRGIQQDLDGLEQRLIKALFPRRPDAQNSKPAGDRKGPPGIS